MVGVKVNPRVNLLGKVSPATASAPTCPTSLYTRTTSSKRPRKLSLRFAPGMLIEGTEHSERHGLNAGFDGRFRHRREQRRMIGRQLRAGSGVCRGDAF